MLDENAPGPRLQRARGASELRFGRAGLEHLYQSGCAKILLPKTYGAPEAVLINSSGGVTGGDRLRCEIELTPGAELTVTTQAAERIYRASAGIAQVENHLTLAAGATLCWLPQETILFDGCALSRQLNVSLADTSVLLAVETLVLGRSAMGERLNQAHLRDRWRIMRGGRLIHGECLRFDLPGAGLDRRACFDGAKAVATLVYVAPDAETRLSGMRQAVEFDGVEIAASAWQGKLVARFLARDAQLLRRALMSLLTWFRGQPLPRVWHM